MQLIFSWEFETTHIRDMPGFFVRALSTSPHLISLPELIENSQFTKFYLSYFFFIS